MNGAPCAGFAAYGLTAAEALNKLFGQRSITVLMGITATDGIDTNLFLANVAKKMPADKDGVRIAERSLYYEKVLFLPENRHFLPKPLVFFKDIWYNLSK